MAERRALGLYSIPPHRAFADALAIGLLRRFGADPLAMARGLVLVPNNRAKRAITDAFVRASGTGLLLPRLVAIGDPELDEASGALFDPAGEDDPVPPAVDPLQRRLILARLVIDERARGGEPVDAGEAVRLAGELARTLDQLLVEEMAPSRLREIDVGAELSVHWHRSLELFGVILDRWPEELRRIGRIDLAERRARLIERTAKAWMAAPPKGFVCAAGITTSAPAIARMLRSIAGLPKGMVVLPGLAIDMPDAEWDSLGPHEPDASGRRRCGHETHPQFALKVLLDRMGVSRGEFDPWRVASELDAPPARSKAIASALTPAEFTHRWTDLPAAERRLGGVRSFVAATPAEEAQAIAIALREVLEEPGETAALVTPDRMLARRVAAHCARWGIAIDDTAGQPLSALLPGTLLLAIADAGAQGFAPVPLLTLLKHPLVRLGEGRGAWLDGVRVLDRALRGPRPASGLGGVDAYLGDQSGRDGGIRRAAAQRWGEMRGLLEPIETAFASATTLGGLIAALREAASALAGDAAWSRAEGRAAATLLDGLEAQASEGPPRVDSASIAPMLRTLMDEIAVRPPQGGHPRLAIYGLLEARLQTADLMILGGLNEGVWPSLPAPDPWLAPRIRLELGLPGLERRIGLSAHDLAGALGAREVLLTRARRDTTAPTIASRFWLRLEALSAGLDRAEALNDWTRAIDDPGGYRPAARPEPKPPADQRPKRISVTQVDRLKADPYAFYAQRMLGLAALDAVDADPSAAWRGTAVHGVLQQWAQQDSCDPAKLRPRAEAMLADARTHPLIRALWRPRLIEAIDWIAVELAEKIADGRAVLGAEASGTIEIAGVTLSGTFDRIDRLPDQSLAIIDYKTGKAPSAAAVRAGFSLQLGLLGLIAERGGFEGIAGTARTFEYWSLAKHDGQFGKVTTPVDAAERYGRILPDAFVALAADNFTKAAEEWLTGDAPFTAKLHPEFAPYAEYDQLMRRDEWYGRE